MPITADPSDIDILVVDDEESVVDVVSHFLSEEGYSVHTAFNGEEALDKASSKIDLIVLDIMLPGVDGYEVCEELRSRVETEEIPIVFLSAKTEDEDQVEGLMLGGDDYLTKPVAPKVLVAHVKAVLRRSGVEESSILEVNGLKIYEDEYRAELHSEDLGLTLTEFELLRYLVRHPKKGLHPPTAARDHLERRHDGDGANGGRPHQKSAREAWGLCQAHPDRTGRRLPVRARGRVG